MEISKALLKNGVMQYTYWDDKDISPVGLVWVTFSQVQDGRVVGLLLYAMTITPMRRKGVCTKIFAAIREDCNIMITPTGSNDGGEEVMKKFGFTLNIDFGMWIYKKEA